MVRRRSLLTGLIGVVTGGAGVVIVGDENVPTSPAELEEATTLPTPDEAVRTYDGESTTNIDSVTLHENGLATVEGPGGDAFRVAVNSGDFVSEQDKIQSWSMPPSEERVIPLRSAITESAASPEQVALDIYSTDPREGLAIGVNLVIQLPDGWLQRD
jgi:hypothetical protein